MKLLSMIGLGITDERSIPLRGLDRLRESDRIFAEFYTSILIKGSIQRLEKLAGKEIEILDRSKVEEEELVIRSFEKNDRVCFVTAGDPLTATTHQELRFDAVDRGIDVEIINSASIFNTAAGFAGMQHYKFGRTTTVAYPEGSFFPTSPLDVMIDNMDRGLHTLVLLDIKAHEERYMSASEASALIMKMAMLKEEDRIGPNTKAIAVLRAGRVDGEVKYGRLERLSEMDLGPPPHCMIIPGSLHFAEEEALERFSIE